MVKLCLLHRSSSFIVITSRLQAAVSQPTRLYEEELFVYSSGLDCILLMQIIVVRGLSFHYILPNNTPTADNDNILPYTYFRSHLIHKNNSELRRHGWRDMGLWRQRGSTANYSTVPFRGVKQDNIRDIANKLAHYAPCCKIINWETVWQTRHLVLPCHFACRCYYRCVCHDMSKNANIYFYDVRTRIKVSSSLWWQHMLNEDLSADEE